MSRVQLAVNVNDIDEAVAFYTKLFRGCSVPNRPSGARATRTSRSVSRR
jgi:hypothetical protein